MDNTYSQNYRSRLRLRSRASAGGSRLTSSSRRPSISGRRRSLSLASLNKLQITPTTIDIKQEKTVPTIAITLDNSLPLDFFKEELILLIKALRVSKWHKHQLTVNNLIVTRILGALTNSIYKIEYRDPNQMFTVPSLLLRVYGKNVDLLIDRESELQILIKLSAKRIGPKLLGIFSNGRFEQFLEGFTTLGKTEIRDPVISQMLARRMKDLHYQIQLDVRDKALEYPVAWVQIIKWMTLFERELKNSYDKQLLESTILMSWEQFRELVFSYREWLFSKYDRTDLSSNYRFCHNDTQYGNLLLKTTFDPKTVVTKDNDAIKTTSNKKDGDLAVIDFEYSGPNFAAYDLADHFSEWMSDYHNEELPYFIHDENYPTQLEQLNMLKSYVEYDFQFPSTNLYTNSTPDVNEADASALIDYEVKKLHNEIIYWRSTVQIFWLIWGLIQNGPVKKDVVDELGSRSEERGVHATYTITSGVEAMDLNDSAIVEEDAITSTDDDFDYLKYAQQKAALILGDMISFGLTSISDTKPEYHNIIKFLPTQVFDI